MAHLLDANTLITARDSYYPLDGVPEFWEWLQYQGEQGAVKIPLEIYEEIKEGPDGQEDLLFNWLQDDQVKAALLLQTDVDPDAVQHVIDQGYAPDLDDTEIEKLGRDPFLIAHALAGGHTVVTVETSAPKKQRANRKVPDVCAQVGVPCIAPFAMYRALKFKTNWKDDLPT
jgi:hypothetical protein